MDDFLSAIGSLLLVLVFGCGSVIAAYMAWTEYQSSGRTFWKRPDLPQLTWDQIRNRGIVAFVLICAGGVLVLAFNARSIDTAQTEAAANAQSQAPAPAIIRTIGSTTCAKDGCPVACQPDETLVSAFCIGATGARLSDTLILDKGVLRAQCASSYRSITVTCTPTVR